MRSIFLRKDSFKVAFFLPSLAGGGAEKVMLNLARGFAQRGVFVELVLASAVGQYLKDVPPEINVIDLNAGRVRTSVIPLARYLGISRPNVLVSAIDHANCAAVIARAITRASTRVAITLHNTPSEKSKQESLYTKALRFFLIRCAHALADVSIAVSSGVAQDYACFCRTSEENITVVYNPVISADVFDKACMPLDHPWFKAGQPPVIVAIGRLTEEKDYPTLIHAFSSVKASGKPCRLMILGEGALRGSLEILIREQGLEADIMMPGFVDNPYQYLANARLFVLSSRTEGLPTALIEALALGTPVVSTNCKSGPAEILQNGRYGQLVSVNDAEALAKAIVGTLENDNNQISKEAWERFEIEYAVDSYLGLLSPNLTKKT